MSSTDLSYIHPNLKLLSHSSTLTLHSCPRKYELYKLTPPRAQDEDGDEHLNFGSLVGLGTQEYLVHGDYNRTIMKMFTSWKEMLDDEKGEKAKKTFWHALGAIDNFIGIRSGPLSNFDVVYFDNKPAIELGFSVDCGDGFFYRGFLDGLLLDKRRHELVVYEGKTTTGTALHEAMYQHSGQSLGYSLVVASIARKLGLEVGASYRVIYSVYKSKVYEWELMPFVKNHTQRALWIKQVLVDKQHIVEYATDNYFPMHGESCYSFYRPCPHFGLCEMSNQNLIGDKVAVREDNPAKYQFHFSLKQLIEDQLSAMSGT
jgi:hypothetical protein